MNKLLALAEKLKANANAPIKAKERWVPLAVINDHEINIMGEIGDDWDESDTTITRVQRKLNIAAGADVTVNINSFGGSMFEGVAIYNALCQYEGKVTVKNLGIAASSASLIAMAGDEIQMADASFLMIHNCWTFAIGNRHELSALIQNLAVFDEAMAGIYSSRMGMDKKEIQKMMDEETYISGESAMDKGIATSLFDPKSYAIEDKSKIAAHEVDKLLAKQGVPRSKRRDLLKEIKGTQNAAQNSTQNATDNELILALNNICSQ